MRFSKIFKKKELKKLFRSKEILSVIGGAMVGLTTIIWIEHTRDQALERKRYRELMNKLLNADTVTLEKMAIFYGLNVGR